MLFNSLAFLIFFPAVCTVYFCIPRSCVRLRGLFLLASSYYFYMNWNAGYALLLLTSTVVTYGVGLGIERTQQQGRRKALLTLGIVVNLLILLLFKYYGFLATNVEWLLSASGLGIELPRMDVLLPVGISFYTFQALGYSIDVYRGQVRAERDFCTYALFVSFFPQLVAGPIERSSHLLPQFRTEHSLNYRAAMSGLCLMAWGYFMKLVMADRAGMYVDAVFNNLPNHNGGSYLLASLLFPFQIYGDFAGYSLIAIGAARVMGFSLMQNFRQPYLATSVGDFWHRWHISLSTWFKDYVYIPLGGNRLGNGRRLFNLLVTFVVSGAWHGANWTFICWGAFHGLVLCVEKLLGKGRPAQSRIAKAVQTVLTFVVVSAAWVVFRADSMTDVLTVFGGIFTRMGTPFVGEIGYGVLLLTIVAIAVVMLHDSIREYLKPKSVPHSTLAYVAYITTFTTIILLFGMLDGSQFIYFQF